MIAEVLILDITQMLGIEIMKESLPLKLILCIRISDEKSLAGGDDFVSQSGRRGAQID